MALGVAEVSADWPVQLACTVDRSALSGDGAGFLRCAREHRFPVVDGIPVLLDADRLPAIGAAAWSWKRATGEIAGDARAPELYLESLGISESEKSLVVELWKRGPGGIDPAVQMLVGATCGIAYKGVLGALKDYPIPRL